jgi:tRNA 5-methylaminomethyl-2-thiouridine biosynthesis bifunctional protein
MYDAIVVGAGSAGAHAAYFLRQKGLRVAVAEMAGVASGASGAAGAFISPRLGKGGPLQRVTNEAFRFAVSFYSKNFPHLFYPTGILRLPKDADDAKKFAEYEPFIDVRYEKKGPADLGFLRDYAAEFGGYYFLDGGVVEAVDVCRALLKDIDCYHMRVERIERKDGLFRVGELRAARVVVATGAWSELLPPYIRLGRLGGYRFDIRCESAPPVSLHKRISVSAQVGGRVIVGATHTRVDDPAASMPPSGYLLDEARKMVDLGQVELSGMFCGVRPSVNDHFPFAGEVVDVERGPKGFGRKETPKELPRKEGLYVLGGYGGRGFVFGPWAGERLATHIAEGAPLPESIDADRLYIRWARNVV